jgi:Icc-related predicted phosphoesterase
VKILAISDEVVDSLYSPRIKDRFADVDLVLGCGDLPYYYLEFVVTMLDVPLYYVPGNHDKPEQYLSDGRIIHRAEGCEPLDGRLACVTARHSAESVLLGGLGGSLRYNLEKPHQYTQAEMLNRVLGLVPRLLLNHLRFGRYLDILVTHAPARGIHDGSDLAHTGFDAFLRLMDWFHPRFLLHGHSHVYRSDAVTSSRYGRTEVLNVYPYRVIELEVSR